MLFGNYSKELEIKANTINLIRKKRWTLTVNSFFFTFLNLYTAKFPLRLNDEFEVKTEKIDSGHNSISDKKDKWKNVDTYLKRKRKQKQVERVLMCQTLQKTKTKEIIKLNEKIETKKAFHIQSFSWFYSHFRQMSWTKEKQQKTFDCITIKNVIKQKPRSFFQTKTLKFGHVMTLSHENNRKLIFSFVDVQSFFKIWLRIIDSLVRDERGGGSRCWKKLWKRGKWKFSAEKFEYDCGKRFNVSGGGMIFLKL